jgi:hypothetical protein
LDPDHTLGRRIERASLARRVPVADRDARLHRAADDPVVDEIERDRLVSAGEGRLDGAPVMAFPVNAEVRAALGVEEWRVGPVRGRQIDDRRQRLVVDPDQLGGVARLVEALGDDESHRVTDIADHAARQHRAGRREHLLAASPRHLSLGRDLGHAIGVEVLDRENAENPRRGSRRLGVDRGDPGMRMRRAQDIAVGLSLEVDVVGEPAFAGDEVQILSAPHRLANAELLDAIVVRHRSLGRSWFVKTADAAIATECSGAFTP